MSIKVEVLSPVKYNMKQENHGINNAIVVLERLPEHVVKSSIHNKENIKVKYPTLENDRNITANLCSRFCEKCKKVIKCNLKMKTRCPKCNSTLTFECKKCKKHVISYSGMLYHLRTVCQSEGHYYECPGCPYRSAFKVRIKTHMLKLHKDMPVSNMKVIASQDLQKDRKTSEILVHKCPKCSNHFRQLHYLKKHLKGCGNHKYRVKNGNENENSEPSHQSDKIPDTLHVKRMSVLYCVKCAKKTALDDSVYGPQKCSNCKSVLIFECTKCEKQYKSAKGMMYHLKTKCDAQEEMYFCTKCDYKCQWKSSVNEHYKTVHEAVSLECPKCKEVYKNKRTLDKHLGYCGKEAYLECDICYYKTKTRSALLVHIKRHDDIDNNIEASCPNCKKKLKNQFSLRCHLHYCGIEQRYHCTICEYKSHYKKGLREHMIRMHFKDESKNPACPRCGVKLPYKRCANAHLRFCGTSKSHFQCDDCPFKCNRKDAVLSHITRLHLRNHQNLNDNSDIDVEN